MIPADGSHYVHYQHSAQGLPVRPVIAWDDDGNPLVTGKRGLVPAYEMGTIKYIRRDSSPAVGAVPGGGWLIECKDDEGNTWTTPILAWTVHADGSAQPLTSDRDGITGDATEGLESYRIYHPDATDVSSAPAE